jgi:hypothetical protein
MKILSFRPWPLISVLSCLANVASDLNVSASDVKIYVIDKGIQYFQTSVAAPVADANNGVSFETDVKASGSNLVTAVTLKLPNATTVAVPQIANDEFKLKKKYDKQTGVDGAFPDGPYVLAMATLHDGTKTLTLALTGDTYPNVPRISNFPATQALDPGGYFLFTWDPFVGGTANDFVQLHIDDSSGNKVWETPDIGEAGVLNGLATSTLMPPGTLAAGQSYQARLDYGKAVTLDRTNYPGALGLAQYYKRTKFIIQTTAIASAAPVKLYTLSKSRRFQQVGLGTPTPQSSKTFDIDAALDASAVAAVTSVALAVPTGVLDQLALQSDDKSFQFSDANLTQAGLDATYPDGQYTFHITTPLGSKNPVLNVSGGAYPDAPHLTTLANDLNVASDWSVSWDPFNGGTSSDFVQFHIDDDQGNKVFGTPDLGKSGAFNGTSTQSIVPSNTFAAGKTYTGRVIFQKNLSLDTVSYPGALGVASYASRTTFQITTSSPPPAPHLAVVAFSGSGDFDLTVQTAANATVRVDTSIDLKAWNPISTNTVPSGGVLTINDAGARTQSLRYYRGLLLQ